MSTPDILQMSLDAKAQNFVSEFLEKEYLLLDTKAGYRSQYYSMLAIAKSFGE